MWQTVLVLAIVAGVLVYVIRYYARAARSESPCCSGCAGCCGPKSGGGETDCAEGKTPDLGTGAAGGGNR